MGSDRPVDDDICCKAIYVQSDSVKDQGILRRELRLPHTSQQPLHLTKDTEKQKWDDKRNFHQLDGKLDFQLRDPMWMYKTMLFYV